MDLTPTPRRMRRPGRWGVTAGVALIALGLLSFNAFATFTAQVTPTHATDTGDMELAVPGAGANHRIAVASTDIAPGDTIQRTLTLNISENDGSVMSGVTFTGRCASGDPCTQTFVTDDTNGLQIWIAKCSQAWDLASGVDGSAGTTYTCDTGGGATQSDVLGTSGSPVNFDNQAATTLNNLTLTGGASNLLLVRFTLPSAAPDSMEDQAETLQLQFDGVQRAGTNK